MGIFVLRLLVVPHLLLTFFPIFPILFFKFFNKNVYFKQNAVEIDFFFDFAVKILKTVVRLPIVVSFCY